MAQNAIEHSDMQLILKHNFPETALPITFDELENALSAANITCSTQGIALIQRASAGFWDGVDVAACARIWPQV
jgi:6-phosphogluconate dehydrogenase